jgi:hypothetical protein
MLCSYHSNRRQFRSEICIHVRGIDKPAVFSFPLVSVCLECGSTEFMLGERELQDLRNEAVSEVQGANQNGLPE